MSQLVEKTSQQLATRQKIDLLEDLLTQGIADGVVEQTMYDGASPEGDAQAEHFFGDGVYARAVEIPAGTCVVGKIHKQNRVCIVAKGSCTFADDSYSRTVEAPFIAEFQSGTKTAVYAHTDTVWVACVGTDLKDPVEALNTLSAKDYSELE